MDGYEATAPTWVENPTARVWAMVVVDLLGGGGGGGGTGPLDCTAPEPRTSALFVGVDAVRSLLKRVVCFDTDVG